jgi:PAS domain S-box-containing protein
MTQPLRVLIAEDNLADAELLLRELRRAGFEPNATRVDTEADYLTHLHDDLDLILADYAMPQFTGLRALELLKQWALPIPFILVSGTMGEETAVAAMRSGAADYLLKDRLTRLGQAVHRVLEEKRLREQRHHAEERLRQQTDIINSAHDAIIIRDLDSGCITFWNNGAECLYGWTAEEAIGKELGQLIFADPSQLQSHTQELLATGECRGEIKQRTKDGKELIVDTRKTLVRNPDGSPRSVLIINNDITEQKKLESQLLRSQRLESIGTLASGVAHDLNNILTPILVCAQTLQGGPSVKDVKALGSLMELSARRGASIVKQVLTFARGVEGKRVSIKPTHLIEEMTDIARKTFPKSIEITSRYREDLATIEADPTQLHQVLLNLSVNARDAMPGGGALMIAAENFHVDAAYASTFSDARPGPYVLFRVTDTGTGMSREVIDKIFDPFFTTKEAGKGTGLGLSTAFGIVKTHGGFIAVESEVGRGTTFKIFLPAQLKELARESGLAPELLTGHGEVVLIVDDEPNILQIAKMALEKKNYAVLSASDGREALKIFSEQSSAIKAVVTDMGLPRMDGVTLAREIKKIKPDATVIASTGQGELTDTSQLAPLGVVNFLNKPYDTGTLLQTLSDALEGKPSGSPDET